MIYVPSSKIGKENLLKVYKTFAERGLIPKRILQSHDSAKKKVAYINNKYTLVPITLKGLTKDEFRRKHHLAASDIYSPSKRKRGAVDQRWRDSPNPDQSVYLEPEEPSSESEESEEDGFSLTKRLLSTISKTAQSTFSESSPQEPEETSEPVRLDELPEKISDQLWQSGIETDNDLLNATVNAADIFEDALEDMDGSEKELDIEEIERTSGENLNAIPTVRGDITKEDESNHNRVMMANKNGGEVTMFSNQQPQSGKLTVPHWRRTGNLENDAMNLRTYIETLKFLSNENANEAFLIYQSFSEAGNDNLQTFHDLPKLAKVKVSELEKYLQEVYGLTLDERRKICEQLKRKQDEPMRCWFSRCSHFVYFSWDIDPVSVADLEKNENTRLKAEVTYVFLKGLEIELKRKIESVKRDKTMEEIIVLASDIDKAYETKSVGFANTVDKLTDQIERECEIKNDNSGRGRSSRDSSRQRYENYSSSGSSDRGYSRSRSRPRHNENRRNRSYSRGRRDSYDDNYDREETRRCFKCKKVGHLIADCWGNPMRLKYA